jgi:hypothetical protein
MRLCRPDWFRLLVIALVFGLTCGGTAPALWAAPQSVTSSAPEEEDETQTKAAGAERRAVKPAREPAAPALRPRRHPPLLSPTATVSARPAAALMNGLGAHYRC